MLRALGVVVWGRENSRKPSQTYLFTPQTPQDLLCFFKKLTKRPVFVPNKNLRKTKHF